MKRRDLFKAIATLCVGAVCAPLAKAFTPRRIETNHGDVGESPMYMLSMRGITAGNDDLFTELPEGMAERIHAEQKAEMSKDIDAAAHSSSFLNHERRVRLATDSPRYFRIVNVTAYQDGETA